MMRRFSFLVVFASLGMLVVSVAPASADPICCTRNWGGNHVLYDGGPVSGDYAAFWQEILVSDQSEMTVCGSTGIDGNFGGYTAYVTGLWQGRHNLNNDGVVGLNTWNQASVYSDGYYYYGRFNSIGLSDGGTGLFFLNYVTGSFNDTQHPDLVFYPC